MNLAPAVLDAAKRSRVRAAGVTLLRASDPTGRDYLMALSEQEPHRGYVLSRDRKTGAWVCPSCVSIWKRGACAHVEAAQLADEEEGER